MYSNRSRFTCLERRPGTVLELRYQLGRGGTEVGGMRALVLMDGEDYRHAARAGGDYRSLATHPGPKNRTRDTGGPSRVDRTLSDEI